MELNAVLVRNKGFPVTMAKVEPVPDSEPARWRQVVTDDDEAKPVTRTVWVRFDANSVADVETLFGSVDAYQAALAVKSHATLRQVLALVLELPEREVGASMLPEEGGDYLLAVSMAWSVAMGMDPTQAAKAMELGRIQNRKTDEEERAEVAAGLEEAVAALSTTQSPSPGETGTDNGLPSEGTPSSSDA